MTAEIIHGDCLEVMRGMADNSVDAIVTDPPYELGFMGRAWDRSGVAYNADLWREVLRVAKPGAHLLAFGGTRTYHRMACAIEDAGFEIRDQLQWLYGRGYPKSATTSLKPANEPVALARKPLSEPTLEANADQWGTGALNTKDCRVGESLVLNHKGGKTTNSVYGHDKRPSHDEWNRGRFPANVLLDELAAVDMGANGRYFFTAKASAEERAGGNDHPTVKPVMLMRYLVRLVTPPNGIVLDPFAGSGTTVVAAAIEGFSAIGIEQDEHYAEIARKRVSEATSQLRLSMIPGGVA